MNLTMSERLNFLDKFILELFRSLNHNLQKILELHYYNPTPKTSQYNICVEFESGLS